MRAWAILAATLMASGTASAQNVADWKREQWRKIVDPAATPTADKVEEFLRELRLDAMPDKPINYVYTVVYSARTRGFRSHYQQPNSRESPRFTPDDAIPGDCAMLVDHEVKAMFDPAFRQAFGIELRPVDDTGKYTIEMAEYQGSVLGRYYDAWADPFVLRESAGGARYYRQELKAGDKLEYHNDDAILGTSREMDDFGHAIRYRVPQGVCGYSYNQMTVMIPLRIGVKVLPQAAPAPKRKEEMVAAPKGGNPALMLTRTGPPAPKPEAPQAIVYKPGVRPTPPVPPKLPPCPKGLTCAIQEDGPLTAEGIAYRQQLDAYQVALKEFEAQEAAKRQAVADLNKQKQAEYSANLAAIEKQRTDALAARDAKIAADKAAYNAQLKAFQAESARRTAEHEAAMAEWRRKTAACLAGDMSQCANSGDK